LVINLSERHDSLSERGRPGSAMRAGMGGPGTWKGERVAGRRLGFWRRFVVAVLKPPLTLMTRRDWRGMEHVPAEGGVILVINHVSHADPFMSAHFVYDSGRWPQFLGKASVFGVPLVGWLLREVRQIPVQRGTVDAARALDAAIAAVKAGGAVVIYPEGTTTKDPDLWPMRGKTGVARLWLATGAPVVPVAVWGPQAIFHPRTGKLRLRPRTPVTVVAGPPVDLAGFAGAGAGAEATTATLHRITEVVMLRLRDLVADIRGAAAPPLWEPGTRPGAAAAESGADGGPAR
jgi:1-acyl-sn-glycerol-3-phosphate acyltransferase